MTHEPRREDERMVTFACIVHPTDWFHEVGCSHQEWTKEQLLGALIAKKRLEEEHLRYDIAERTAHQQAMQGLEAQVKELEEALVIQLGCHETIATLELERDRLQERIKELEGGAQNISYNLFMDACKQRDDATERADRLQAEVERLTFDCNCLRGMFNDGALKVAQQNSTLTQQLAEAQAEVDKWTRMAACAGFDKTGLLAVGEELQKRDKQLADQRAEMEDLLVDRNQVIAKLSKLQAENMNQRAEIERLKRLRTRRIKEV